MAPHILIVEDEPDIRELLNFTITRAGFDVIEAESAEDALPLLDRGLAPELIIIDWMLPGMDGILAKKLRTDDVFGTLPIIMLTARGEEIDKLEASKQVSMTT